MKVRRGDVFWATLRGQRRPVVILTRDPAIPLLDTVAVAPLTRTVRDIPSEVRLSRADGIPQDSAVSLDNIQSIPKRDLRARITGLPTGRLEELCEALRYTLGC